MHYRWSYPENTNPFIYYFFGNSFGPDFDYETKVAFGEQVGQKFRGFCKPLGINDETAPEIERTYKELLGELTVHFDEYPFFLGFRPSLGDFSIHGSIYAHLLRDPVPGKVTKTTAPAVASWCERMAGHVFESKFFDIFDVVDEQLVAREPESTDFLNNDEIPETLIPILQRIVTEMTPNMAAVIDQLEEYAGTKPTETQLPKPLMKKVS